MLSLLILIAVLGLVAYLVQRYLPIAPKFKSLIYFVLLMAAVLAVLQGFGVFRYLDRPVPSLHR